MCEEKLKLLQILLDEYYEEKTKICHFDCYNCELGAMPGYGYSNQCAIELVEEQLARDLQN